MIQSERLEKSVETRNSLFVNIGLKRSYASHEERESEKRNNSLREE